MLLKSTNYSDLIKKIKGPNSFKLEKVPIEEFEQTFDYGLKDITKSDDYNQVVDWENSSFYQATNQSSSVIS